MMQRLFIRVLFALLAAAAAAGEPSPGRGLGGTGLRVDDGGSGIGGTGYQPSGDGRGIGGTGIVGTIRAFGSIWVNGVEVQYWEDQTVSLDDRPGTSKDLRVGQVVAVEAQLQADRLVARSIEVRHAVVGPVTSIDTRAGSMQVLGQRVRMPAGDTLGATLRPGDWVSVSGLREPKGTVIASLLERTPEGLGAFVRGAVEQVDARGLVVGGHRYPLPPGSDPSAIPVGADLTLYGDPKENQLTPTRLRVGWVVPFEGLVRTLLVEGFVGTGGRQVGALVLPDSAYRPKVGERVVVQGRFGSDGKLDRKSLRILSAPSGLDRMRLRLEDLEGGQGSALPTTPQSQVMERAWPTRPYRSRGAERDRPTGLSPRPQASQVPGQSSPAGSPWYQYPGPLPAQGLGPGWLGNDPLGPGYWGGSSGFPSLAPSGAGGGGAGGGVRGSTVSPGRGGR